MILYAILNAFYQITFWVLMLLSGLIYRALLLLGKFGKHLIDRYDRLPQ